MGIPSPAWAARAPRALAVLLALLTLGLVAAPSPAAADPGEHKVVFIGAPGLAWSDVSPEATPAIWAALGDSVGSLAVRSGRRVACPLDGWLALNTSARAAGPSARCDVLVDPIDSILPVWPQVEEALAEQNYAASPGLLARNLAAAGASAVAIGPGAGVALANENGRVPRYEARRTPGEGLASQVARAVEAHDLTIIDAGPLRPAPKGAYSTPGQFRADHLRIINNRIEAVFRGVEAAAATPTVILAGLADDDDAATRLFAITGPGVPRGTLTSPSTRQEGYTLATDLQATVLAALGVEDRSQGAAAYTIESDASVSELVAAELDR